MLFHWVHNPKPAPRPLSVKTIRGAHAPFCQRRSPAQSKRERAQARNIVTTGNALHHPKGLCPRLRTRPQPSCGARRSIIALQSGKISVSMEGADGEMADVIRSRESEGAPIRSTLSRVLERRAGDVNRAVQFLEVSSLRKPLLSRHHNDDVVAGRTRVMLPASALSSSPWAYHSKAIEFCSL